MLIVALRHLWTPGSLFQSLFQLLIMKAVQVNAYINMGFFLIFVLLLYWGVRVNAKFNNKRVSLKDTPAN